MLRLDKCHGRKAWSCSTGPAGYAWGFPAPALWYQQGAEGVGAQRVLGPKNQPKSAFWDGGGRSPVAIASPWSCLRGGEEAFVQVLG